MRSPKLKQLQQLNNSLNRRAWSNYHTWLRILLRSIDHEDARTALGLLDKGLFNELLMFADSLSSTASRTVSEHRIRSQLAAVIKKYPYPTGVIAASPRDKAIETFLKSERKCARINRKFRLLTSLRDPYSYDLSLARNWISYVLGDLSLTDVWNNCNFGPGSSIGVHGNATNAARKLLNKSWSVSTGAFYYAYASMSADMHICELLLRDAGRQYFSLDPSLLYSRFAAKASVVDNNKIAFVPKTALTERTIAVEPLLNGYIQKGLDSVMRNHLKRVGINLEDQTLNQHLAFKGSRDWQESDPYVTIDLSSASDSISTELCRYILPPDWFDFMNSIRSKSYSLMGKQFTYEKFTTMGNGFCFPLETLIFASLCEASYKLTGTKADYSVYGDDIIVRKSHAPKVLDLLKTCGFTANPKKTFLEGPFRESCGADWFEGKDVRPISLDYAFDSFENIVKFCNLCKTKPTWECMFSEANEFLVSLIPQELMFVRPFRGNVDTALEVPYDVFMCSPFARWSVRTQSWSWVELQKSAYLDLGIRHAAGYDVALMRGALSGSTSPAPFAERRRSRTKIRRYCPSAGWSVILPSNWPCNYNLSVGGLSISG